MTNKEITGTGFSPMFSVHGFRKVVISTRFEQYQRGNYEFHIFGNFSDRFLSMKMAVDGIGVLCTYCSHGALS